MAGAITLHRVTDSVKSSHFGKSLAVEFTFPGKRMHPVDDKRLIIHYLHDAIVSSHGVMIRLGGVANESSNSVDLELT